MKRIILTMLVIFALSTTTAFPSADIAGKYEYKGRKGEYGGTITIKQSTNNEYDVEIYSFTSTRQDGSTYTWCATLSGKGRIIDGVLVVKNIAKEIGTDKTLDVFTRVYLNKHPDIEKFIESNKNDKKNANFTKELSAMSTSQIAIVQIAEPINHGGYEVSGKEECDRGGGIDVGIFTKSGARQAETRVTPATRQTEQPSFDCAKASNAVERTICAEPMLAHYDVRVASEYKQALSVAADKEALKADQRRWLQQMHSQCAKTPNLTCIAPHYTTRLTQIRQLMKK